MNLKSLMSRVGRSERGFTLIELLVVVAILGIIAAVVVLNVGSFLGSGTEQAANTELHQVQTAVVAYMAYYSQTTWDGTFNDALTDGPAEFLLNPARLQCSYTVVGGVVTAGTAGGQFVSCTWGSGAWTC